MASGNKQPVLLAIAGGAFALLMIAGIAGNIVRGNYIAIPIVLLLLAFVVVAIWVAILFNRRQIQAMFRHPTPDKLIEHYHASQLRARARKIPNADAAAADLSALAAAVYGQYDRARAELDAVEWNNTPPAYRGRRLDTLALMALLEDQDKGRALQIASEARSVSGEPTPLRDAVTIAAGEGDTETLERAQRTAGRGIGAVSAISAWALSLYCRRNGQAVEAQRYLDRAKEAAAHFVGLSVT